MIPVKVRKAVIARAGQLCERCSRWCDIQAGDYSLQHRRARGMGGSRLTDTNAAVNLALMCGSATTPGGCHSWAEANPLEAEEEGWRVRQGHDPAVVPILHHEHGPVLLAADYTYEGLASA